MLWVMEHFLGNGFSASGGDGAFPAYVWFGTGFSGTASGTFVRIHAGDGNGVYW